MSSCGETHALCRVCAKPFESSTMFRLLNELADAFWRVSEIEMQADGSRFPQSCCLKCRDRLQEVEELRALCLDSDRKLRKMIGIGLREEEEGDGIGMDNIDAIPKVEMQEFPESYSCWEDMENRFESSEEDNDKGNHLDSVPDVVKQTPGKTTKENAESKVKRKPKATKSGSDKPPPKTKGPKTPKEPKSFQCTMCGKIYKTSYNLKEHETSHNSDQKNHKCHICLRDFARRKYFLEHLRMHETENQFKCNECDKAYSTNRLLQQHIRVTHSGERPFQCSICPKNFARASSLHVHVQSVHKKIRKKTFRCDKCTRSFEGKTAFERHMNSHEGIKLNQCPHCGNKYEFKAYLLQHIAEKHPETVENLTTCQFCGVGYSTDGYYRKHIVKRHPEHLEVFDQWIKAKREEASTSTC
ncbi:hypothetical protein pipiens_003875 [Culex pipiens pipiens]|uniref:Uncharacterized protein n=2 Tax=Culex pipiens TaxID=7175 RepID=A0ABD1CRA9_CULPP